MEKKYMKRHWKKRFLYQRKWWAGTVPFLLFLASCVYMIETKGITKHTILDAAAQYLQANLGYQAVKSCMPVLAYDAAFDAEQITIYEYLAANMLSGASLIDLQDFPESGDQEFLVDAWMEAVYQNPMILGAQGASLLNNGKTMLL